MSGMGVSAVLRNIRNITHITPTKGRIMQRTMKLHVEMFFRGEGADCFVNLLQDGSVQIALSEGDESRDLTLEFTFTEAEWDALTQDLSTLRYIARKEAPGAQEVTQQLNTVVLSDAQVPEPEWLDELPSAHDTAVADGI